MENPMPDESPILMFNALWFKPDGGAEKYREYMAAASPIMVRHGGKKRTGGIPNKAIIGDFDADLIFFIEWPSQAAFQAFIADPEFESARDIREAAIRDSLLIRCNPA